MPDLIPSREKELLRFLYAVRHVERRPATDTKRGRPSRWPRERLVEAAGRLRGILDRETSGRISVSSFIGQYLPILLFPNDVITALSEGHINLPEAAQLARLTPERLGNSASDSRRLRQEILATHLAARGSQTRLRSRVKELLGEAESASVTSGAMAEVLAKADELLEVDPSDSRHLFWEEMKRIFFSMREVEPEDLDDEALTDLMAAVDELSNVLARIERLRARRKQEVGKLAV